MKIFRLIIILVLSVGVFMILASALVGPRESFIVRTTDSFVTVFRASNPSDPYLKTEINEALLRENDRLLLSVGIRVNNEAELWSILEDLGS